jgi:competence protein ComEA
MGVTSSRGPAPDDVRLAFALAAALLVGELLVRSRAPGPPPGPPAFERHAVDVNAAVVGEIEALPGVGRVLAERIVAERARGVFASADDLRRVPGVGPTTLARMRPFVETHR